MRTISIGHITSTLEIEMLENVGDNMKSSCGLGQGRVVATASGV